jgi:uncharacterized RDD family membrane protein YckC
MKLKGDKAVEMEITDPLGSPEKSGIEPFPPVIEKEEIPLQEGVPLTPVLQPAGFIRRAIAFLIDFFIVEFLYLILIGMGMWGIQLSGGRGGLFPSDSLMTSLAIPFIAVWFFLFIAYFTFFHFYDGQTPAKMIIRIKVADRAGNPLSFPQALVRSFGYFLSGFFFGFGFLFSIFERKKRALHDLLVGSYVILS